MRAFETSRVNVRRTIKTAAYRPRRVLVLNSALIAPSHRKNADIRLKS